MTKPTKKKIEIAAVSYISDIISRCHHLDPCIDSNDKTPFTDGHIDIHNIPGSEKVGTHSGRVPVQIKGTTGKFKGKKFKIKREYLSAYLVNSGVLFFVVAMDKDLQNRRAYYCNLNPFKIYSILQSIPEGQKTVSFKLKACPTAPGDIEKVVKYSFETRRENLAASAAAEYVSTDEFLLRLPEKIDFSKPQVLNRLEDDYSLEIKLPDGRSIPFYAEIEITPSDYCYREIWDSISSGGITFDKIYRRRINDDVVELKLSEGLWFQIGDRSKNISSNLNVRLQNNLAACLKDLRFYFSFFSDETFSINGSVQRYQLYDSDKDSQISEYLTYLETLTSLLSDLGVQELELIDLDVITESQHNSLEKLYLSVVKEEWTSSSYERPMRYRPQVGKWYIETILIPDSSNDNRARCFNLFSSEAAGRYIHVPKEKVGSITYYVVTPFDIIDPEVFPYVINLPLEKISDYYEEIKEFSGAFDLVNAMVLRLINSADLVPLRKEVFLNAAFDLNEWLILQSGEQSHHLVNRWQIAKRKGQFNDEVKNYIRELILDPGISIDIRLACWILLENKDEVEFLLGKLDENYRQVFREWPIWKLYEDVI